MNRQGGYRREVNGLTFDFGTASYGGKSVRLTRSECVILKALAEASPKPCTLSRLLWLLHPDKEEDYVSRLNIKVHIFRIRRKLKDAGIPLRIEARRGFGYRLCEA